MVETNTVSPEFQTKFGMKQFILSGKDYKTFGYKSKLVVGNVGALRVPSVAVGLEEDISGIVGDMIREIESIGEKAMGLSAIQIGIPKKILVMRVARLEIGYQYLVMVNPKLIDAYDVLIYPNEGCISFPGMKITTSRFQYCTVVDDVRQPGRTFEGMMAVAMQHELSHLDGKLFFDFEYKKQALPNRNEPCFCGSGKKFKRCCMGKV